MKVVVASREVASPRLETWFLESVGSGRVNMSAGEAVREAAQASAAAAEWDFAAP